MLCVVGVYVDVGIYVCRTQVVEYGVELELGSSNWKSEMNHVYS